MSEFRALSAVEQLQLLDDRVHDPRGVVPTGWLEVDDLLRRGGLAPSTFVILGGRTRTRKTTLTLNLVNQFLAQGVPVGLVGLDESAHDYALKLMSVMSGHDAEYIEEHWDARLIQQLREEYTERAGAFTLSKGFRPSMERLSQWREMAEVSSGEAPHVVFLDYVSLLARDTFAGAEVQRIHRLIEELQVWTNDEGIVTVALHQVGRLDEGASQRYHGDTPMSLESLKFGGEEVADIVMGTYRPSLDPVGNMSPDQAHAHLGERFDEEEYHERVSRVKRYRNSTFVQLLKNRPGTKVHEQGIEFVQEGASMAMQPKGPKVTHDMKREAS